MKATPAVLADNTRGQIRPHVPFGQVLTQLARTSEIIVETGTWRGLGSTYCLSLGLERHEQRLYTVELNIAQHEEAKSYYDDPRIIFIHGTLVLPHEVPPFEYPDSSFKKYYDIEVETNKTVPYVLDQLPPHIDLLLIDGGAWSGEVEFAKLWERSDIIALDDTHPDYEVKNVRNRQRLIDAGWLTLYDVPNERHGWAVFKRPPCKPSTS